jgi:hypothetical protein
MMNREARHPHDLADEIVQVLDRESASPARDAASYLLQAKAAGEGPLRNRHVTAALQQIAKLDPRRRQGLIHRLQGEALALLGRNSDTMIAHLTPNEVVVPHSLQTPDLMNLIASTVRAQGIDPLRLRVGTDGNFLNPRTGQAEFAEDAFTLDNIPEINVSSHPLAGVGPDLEDQIPDVAVSSYPMVGVMPDDVDALARLMISESTSETTPGLYQALGWAAKNRVGNSNINNSDTLRNVIQDKTQFQGLEDSIGTMRTNTPAIPELWPLQTAS